MPRNLRAHKGLPLHILQAKSTTHVAGFTKPKVLRFGYEQKDERAKQISEERMFNIKESRHFSSSDAYNNQSTKCTQFVTYTFIIVLKQ